MPVKYLFLIIICISLKGCFADDLEERQVESIKIEFNEILNISNHNVQGVDDLLLGAPHQTITDVESNIYTLDSQQKMIFKFDSTGNFIGTYGKEGKGPGEFQSVNGMLINDDNQLMVLDFPSQRYTVFNDDRSIDTNMLENPYARFKPIINSTHLLLPWVENGKIIHSYDLEKNEITNRFIDVENVLQTDEEYERRLLSQNTGSLLSLSEDRIVFTPIHYNGNIFVYDKVDGHWEASEHLSGYRQIDQTFTIHETIGKPHKRAQTIIPQSNSIIGIELNSWSIGLFNLNDDKFAHVSFSNGLEGGQINLVIEIFDSDKGELEKFTTTDQFSFTSLPEHEQVPVWMDHNEHLYIADRRSEPSIRKFELSW